MNNKYYYRMTLREDKEIDNIVIYRNGSNKSVQCITEAFKECSEEHEIQIVTHSNEEVYDITDSIISAICYPAHDRKCVPIYINKNITLLEYLKTNSFSESDALKDWERQVSIAASNAIKQLEILGICPDEVYYSDRIEKCYNTLRELIIT